MEIDGLTEADLPVLARRYKQFWGQASCLEKLRATFRGLTDRPDYVFLAAENDGRLVGFVRLHLTTSDLDAIWPKMRKPW